MEETAARFDEGDVLSGAGFVQPSLTRQLLSHLEAFPQLDVEARMAFRLRWELIGCPSNGKLGNV